MKLDSHTTTRIPQSRSIGYCSPCRGQYASNQPLSLEPNPSGGGARIEVMTATITVSVAESVQRRRLVEFASDTAQLADQRLDLELRELIDGLHADLLRTMGEHDD